MTVAEPVGVGEIAERLGVPRNTAHMWSHRGILPEPWRVLAMGPVWKWSAVREWARATGRLPEQRAAKAAASQ